MTLLRSFAPLVGAEPRVLILGSMPGVASLRAVEYYGHPQNAFWWIMQELFAIPVDDSYEERCRKLTGESIALWDVLGRCRREGSLDSDIDGASEQPNDFASLFAAHPKIHTVFFNGAKAEQAWRRHVAPMLESGGAPTSCERMPSTSPAHASLRREQKLLSWRAVANALQR